MKRRVILLTLINVLFAVAPVNAQTPAAPSAAHRTATQPALSRVLGEVVAIDTNAKRVMIKTDAGQQATVEVDEKTVYRRLAPGEMSLDKATAGSFQDVGVGDRVLARGSSATASLRARELVVMSKVDLARKRERERAEWQRRGILGQITTLNPEKKEIVVLARSANGTSPVTITVQENTTFRRYAPDSIRYRDAQQSSFAALKVGDQLRALGDKSADGANFVPAEVVSGTFVTLVGQVTSINAQTGELSVVNAQTEKPLTVVVNKETKLRRLPSDVVKALEQRLAGVSTTGSAPASSAKSSGEDIQETIDNLPPATLADFKQGDALIISSTLGNDPARVTGIMLAAGVDPLLKRVKQQPARRDLNLGLGLPSGINP